MTLPIRRARRRRNLGVTDLAARFERIAPEIELGWNNLKDELNDAGWPSRSPEGDQKPRQPHECDGQCNDPCEEAEGNPLGYNDPTGDLTDPTARLHIDLMALQDHLAACEHAMYALQLIAKRHKPPFTPHRPGCCVSTCDEEVESRKMPNGTIAYIGMQQIEDAAGTKQWVAKPGCTPTCKRHRSRRERDSAA